MTLPATLLLILPGCLWGYYDDRGPTLDGGALDDSGCDQAQPYYEDQDGDSWGGQQAGSACQTPQGMVAVGGDCDDSDPQVHPGADELCDDHLDNDCNADTDPQCRLGDLTASDAVTVFTTEHEDKDLGDRVELCGDLDGDGLPDLALGARARSDSQKGSVYIVSGAIRGSADVDSTDGIFRLRTDSSEDELGSELLCRGDVGADGQDDIAVSAPDHDSGGGTDAGRIGLHFGPLSESRLFDDEADLVIDGTHDNARLGSGMDSADWTGDGLLDLAAGSSTGLDDLGEPVGVVYLFSGSVMAGRSSMTSSDARLTIFGSEPNSELGDRGSLRLADLDGDGLFDLALAAEMTNVGGAADTGRVWVLSDIDGAGAGTVEVDAAAAIQLTPSPEEALNFGAALSSGDLTGDGVEDLVVLAEDNYLAALVYDLSEIEDGAELSEADAVATIARGADGCGGHAVDARGDLDGDGRVDLVFDAYCTDVDSFTEVGIVWGFYGPLTSGGYTAATDADFTVTTEQEGAKLGRDLSTAGDIDQDGRADLLVGAHEFAPGGRAFLFLGTGF